MEGQGKALPRLFPAESLSPSVKSFLNDHLKTVEDLAGSPQLAKQLSAECQSAERRLADLRSALLGEIAQWISQSRQISSSFTSLTSKILHQDGGEENGNLPMNRNLPSSLAKEEEEGNDADNVDLVAELPILAREVAKIERVRHYAETALQLEALVGDLEDGVEAVVVKGTARFTLPRKLGNFSSNHAALRMPENLTSVVSALQRIEAVIVRISNLHPHWKRLIAAVDLRVDHAIASLKPSAIAEYRKLLGLLQWPPPLASVSAEESQEKVVGGGRIISPFLEMDGELKERFELSFTALSSLQVIQANRKERQQLAEEAIGSVGVRRRGEAKGFLWTIEELAAPIASRMEYHFRKWVGTPDLIFALAYRVAQEQADSIDMILQPLLDKASLSGGHNAREDWVGCITTLVSDHLRGQLLSELVRSEMDNVAESLWLHLVDLSISFDKRMRSLAGHSSGLLAKRLEMETNTLDDYGSVGSSFSCLSVFAQRTDYLEIWTRIELNIAQKKLKAELRNERAWLPEKPTIGGLNFSSSSYFKEGSLEDLKVSVGARLCLSLTWAVINRCRSLPEPRHKISFIGLAASPLVECYLGELLQRCQEAEALTALVEERAIANVAGCINDAFFCRSRLLEWSEDLFFLELRVAQIRMEKSNRDDDEEEEIEGSILDGAIASLSCFQAEWTEKIASALQRGFDAGSQEYQRNKRKWQDEGPIDVDISVSSSLLDALTLLQNRLRLLHHCVIDPVFVELWRRLASGLDNFFLNVVALGGGVRLSERGALQLARDIKAVFQVFQPYCKRPANFFPNMSDTIRLLTLAPSDASSLLRLITSSSVWKRKDSDRVSKVAGLKQHGIKWISPETAEKLLSLKILPK